MSKLKLSIKNKMPGKQRMMASQKQSVMRFMQQVRMINGFRIPIGFGICRVDYGQVNRHKVIHCQYPFVNWKDGEDVATIMLALSGFVDIKRERIHDDIYKPELVFGLTREFLKKVLRAMNALANMKGEGFLKNLKVLRTILDLVTAKLASFDSYRVVFIFADAPPQSVESVYLKLMALSSGKTPNGSLNLEGAFAKLDNLAWSWGKPIELEYLRQNEIELKMAGKYPVINYVDKFPLYLNHVIPSDDTRILDSSRVRFGAQLSAGTVVLPGGDSIDFSSEITHAVTTDEERAIEAELPAVEAHAPSSMIMRSFKRANKKVLN